MESKGAYVNDEGYKMALTDALSIAMKPLGIGGNIRMVPKRQGIMRASMRHPQEKMPIRTNILSKVKAPQRWRSPAHSSTKPFRK